jgi:hypothetical protein
MPDAATITVSQALDLLDGPFAELARGVARRQYAFGLAREFYVIGSTISKASSRGFSFTCRIESTLVTLIVRTVPHAKKACNSLISHWLIALESTGPSLIP